MVSVFAKRWGSPIHHPGAAPGSSACESTHAHPAVRMKSSGKPSMTIQYVALGSRYVPGGAVYR